MVIDCRATSFDRTTSAFTVGRRNPIDIFIDTLYALEPVATTFAVPGRCGSIASGSVRTSQTVFAEAVTVLSYTNSKRYSLWNSRNGLCDVRMRLLQ